MIDFIAEEFKIHINLNIMSRMLKKERISRKKISFFFYTRSFVDC